MYSYFGNKKALLELASIIIKGLRSFCPGKNDDHVSIK